ncbi:MAG: hypothetical protein E7212_15185 [Clostridium sartagoforme]|nr:hypothetical protein [Clostridium sartagoforme]
MEEKLILSIAPSIVAGIITYKIATKNIYSDIHLKVANDQLKNVYLPLFLFLEPYLYKKPNINIVIDFIKLFNNIKEMHYELIDSNLMNTIQILEKSIKSNSYDIEDYDNVCSTLDRLFEKTRKFLKLPTRTIYYRLNNHQYNKSSKEIASFIKEIFLEFLPIVLFSFIFFMIKLLFDSFLSLFK